MDTKLWYVNEKGVSLEAGILGERKKKRTKERTKERKKERNFQFNPLPLSLTYQNSPRRINLAISCSHFLSLTLTNSLRDQKALMERRKKKEERKKERKNERKKERKKEKR